MKKIFLALAMDVLAFSFISSLSPPQEIPTAYVQKLSQLEKEQLVALVNELVEQGYDQQALEKLQLPNENVIVWSPQDCIYFLYGFLGVYCVTLLPYLLYKLFSPPHFRVEGDDIDVHDQKVD